MHIVKAVVALTVGLVVSILAEPSWAQLSSPVAGFTRALPYYVLMLQDGSAYVKVVDNPTAQWLHLTPASFSGNKVVGVIAQSTSWGGSETILIVTDAGYVCGYTPCCWPTLTSGVATCYGSIFDATGRAPDEVVDVTLAPQSVPATNTAFVGTARGDVYQIMPGITFLGNVAGLDPTPALRRTIGQLKLMYR